MRLDLDRYNRRVQGWTDTSVESLKAAANGLNIKHRPNSPSRGASLPKLKAKVYTDGVAAERIGFGFRRSLVYTHKGAGRGQAGVVGSTWFTKKEEKRQTNRRSLGQAASGRRVAKPWFNQFIESPAGADELASIAAEELGDAIVNKMLIK